MRRLLRKVREIGFRQIIEVIAWRIIPAPVFRLTSMVILELIPSPDPPADRSPFWAAQFDTAALRAFGHTKETIARRFAAGAKACVMTEGTQALGYVWFGTRFHDEEDLGVRFVLSAGDSWLYDAMVAPERRGRGIYPRLLRSAAYDLRRDGTQRILIAIETANRNSIKSHQTSGARIVAKVTGLRLLGFTVARHSGGWLVGWAGAGCLPLATQQQLLQHRTVLQV
jgi:GNAT superfamily N-acetyltransferase